MERIHVSGSRTQERYKQNDKFSSGQHRSSYHKYIYERRRRYEAHKKSPRSRNHDKGSRGTTGSMLYSIMRDTKTDFQPLPGYGHKTADVMQRINAGVDCDEVYPNVFIGNSGAARNKAYLRRLEVSHILNCAEGRGQVETGEDFYKDVGMRYLGLPLKDDSSADLGCHLPSSSEFIDHALLSGGRVMVNCVMGMSRSCAIVLGFLMLRRGLAAREAVITVRRRRNVRPNGGFLRQLAQLDNRLSRERGEKVDDQDLVRHRDERHRYLHSTHNGRYRSHGHIRRRSPIRNGSRRF